jgi:hypothetical protein
MTPVIPTASPEPLHATSANAPRPGHSPDIGAMNVTERPKWRFFTFIETASVAVTGVEFVAAALVGTVRADAPNAPAMSGAMAVLLRILLVLAGVVGRAEAVFSRLVRRTAGVIEMPPFRWWAFVFLGCLKTVSRYSTQSSCGDVTAGSSSGRLPPTCARRRPSRRGVTRSAVCPHIRQRMSVRSRLLRKAGVSLATPSFYTTMGGIP